MKRVALCDVLDDVNEEPVGRAAGLFDLPGLEPEKLASRALPERLDLDHAIPGLDVGRRASITSVTRGPTCPAFEFEHPGDGGVFLCTIRREPRHNENLE